MFVRDNTVPWRNWAEWKETYKMLYSDNSEEVLAGCRRVHAWEAKGLVPISVEITASIQEELHGQMNRRSLALSIIRFVNGVVDPDKTANYSIPIIEIGDNYGVPRYLIEMRHLATHGKLPSLEYLQTGALDSLKWLKDGYWKLQKNLLRTSAQRVRESLLSFFFEGSMSFLNLPGDLVMTFGVEELVTLMLNPNQTAGTLNHAFTESVCNLISNSCEQYPTFPAAVCCKLAELVDTRGSIEWLRIFKEANLLTKTSVGLIFKWNNNRCDQDLVDTSSLGNIWPPTSIGYLPTGCSDLTLDKDAFIYTSPLDDVPQPAEAPQEEEQPPPVEQEVQPPPRKHRQIVAW